MDANASVPPWVRSDGIDLPSLLGHPDLTVRVLVAGIIWTRTGGRQSAEALPVIAEAIRAGGPSRILGCQLLAEMGPTAGDIVPLVRGLLHEPEPGVRLAAAFALLKCCPDKPVLAEAQQCLAGDDDPVARYVASKLQTAVEA